MKKLLLSLLVTIEFVACITSLKKNYYLQLSIIPSMPIKGDAILFYFKYLDKDADYKLILYTPKKYIYKITNAVNNTSLIFVGIPLFAKNKIIYVLKKNNTTLLSNSFKVIPRQYKVSNLKVKKEYTSPPPEVIDRIIKEAKILKEAKNFYTSTRYWKGKPVFPVNNGVISSPFGHKRIFNKKRIKFHYGVDIAASEGTPIYAIYSGKVIETENFYFSGKTIVITAGAGINIMYAHLSKILVKKGDLIKKGELIGLVGKTGRATGPHLHLGLFINGISVDAMSIYKINLQKEYKKLYIINKEGLKSPFGFEHIYD